MSTDAPSSDGDSNTKAERNPTEKLIVRLLIVLLLIFMVIEAHGRFGYSGTLNDLKAKMKLDEKGQPLNIDLSDDSVTGFPSRTETEATITYRWFSFIKSYGIKVIHDDEGFVTDLQTDLPPEEKQIVIPDEDVDAEPELGSPVDSDTSSTPEEPGEDTAADSPAEETPTENDVPATE